MGNATKKIIELVFLISYHQLQYVVRFLALGGDDSELIAPSTIYIALQYFFGCGSFVRFPSCWRLRGYFTVIPLAPFSSWLLWL